MMIQACGLRWKRVLPGAGAASGPACCASDGLKKLCRGMRPPYAVTDIRMPLAKTVSYDAVPPRRSFQIPPSFLLTACARSAGRGGLAMKQGPPVYLVKPVSLRATRTAAKEFLEPSRGGGKK